MLAQWKLSTISVSLFPALTCQRFSSSFASSPDLDEIQSIPASQRPASQVPYHSTEQFASVVSHGSSPAANQRCGECEELVSTPVSSHFHHLILYAPRYLQALGSHRMDGHLHRRMGEVIDTQGDKADALQYYFDVSPSQLTWHFSFTKTSPHQAFRHNPCDIETLEWLASYYLETQYPEKAVEFCAQAALVK